VNARPHCGDSRRVSVVIASHQRHREVVRAVRSVLDQTLPPVEVVVSNDGPDPEKGRLLANLEDKRVRFVEAPRRRNASATRNFGISQAQGDWIALLDDDDIWLPRKLEHQFEALEMANVPTAILAGVERVYPRQGKVRYRPDGTVQAVNAVHDAMFTGAGGVHTSTVMAPAKAFRSYEFNEDAERHEDWEWLLEAGQELPLVITPEVVCECRLTPGEGLRKPGEYDYTWRWYLRNRHLMPSTTRGRFVSKILSTKAAHDRKLKALPALLGELIDNAALSHSNLRWFLLPWIVPAAARRRLRDLRAS